LDLHTVNLNFIYTIVDVCRNLATIFDLRKLELGIH